MKNTPVCTKVMRARCILHGAYEIAFGLPIAAINILRLKSHRELIT